MDNKMLASVTGGSAIDETARLPTTALSILTGQTGRMATGSTNMTVCRRTGGPT